MGSLRPDLPQPGKGFVRSAAGITPGEFQQRFRWHATHVEAVAAHCLPFHQGDPGPQSCCGDCCHQARGPGSDHHQVVP